MSAFSMQISPVVKKIASGTYAAPAASPSASLAPAAPATPEYKAPTAAPVALPDYSGIENSIKSGYDYQRQKAAQVESGALQAQKDAIARKQAQMGGIAPGGAFIKAEQEAGNQSAQRLQDANLGIDQQQSAELRNLEMTKAGQQFQANQTAANQNFEGAQAKAAAEFQAGQHAVDLAQAKALHDADAKIQADEFGKQMDFSYKQFAQQQKVDDWNHELAQQMANQKDPLEKLLNPSGNLPGIEGGWGSLKDIATGGAFNPLGVAGTTYGAVKNYGGGRFGF